MIDMPRYGKKREYTRGRLIFDCVWLAIFAVVFLLWALFLGRVNKMLEEYESVQPKYKAEEIFNSYFADADASVIAGYGEYTLSEYDRESAPCDYLASVIYGKNITYTSVISSDSAVKTYAVAADGVQFASFTLIQGDEKTDILGMSKWTLGSMDIKIHPVFGVSIYAPKNAVVKVNGKTLTDGHREGDYVELEEAVYFPEDDPDSRLMANYYIDGLFADPTVTVESADGGVGYILEYDKESSAYNAEHSYRVALADAYNQMLLDEERQRQEEADRIKREEEERLQREEEERQRISDSIKALYGDFIYEAMTRYAKYTHITNDENNKTAWEMLAYFKPGTSIYSFIKDYYNYSYYIPDAYEYSGVDMHSFAWTDESNTAFTCIFEMDLVMTVNGSGSEQESKVTENFCLEIHVEITDGKPLISELRNSD